MLNKGRLRRPIQALVVRKEQLKYSSRLAMRVCGSTTHAHHSSVLENNLVTHPETEARTGHVLGRKESFEDTLAHLRFHTFTRICHRESNTRDFRELPVARGTGTHHQAPACLNRVH